jgi:hypothetical protein
VATEHPQDELRVLDSKGCLTLEVLCFSDELPAEQRAVVERHVRSCSICAQQQTSLAMATDRLRRARPRLPVPTELKLLARQLALRSLGHRRRRASSQLRARSHGHGAAARSRERWYRSRSFWIVTLAGTGIAVLLALLAAMLAA